MIRSRGFTLIELLCYLALVTAAIMVIAGIEYTASRAAFLERGLVDLCRDADALGTRFRDDVRQARRILGPQVQGAPRPHGTLLTIALPNGAEVRYEADSAATLASVKAPSPGVKGEKVRLLRKYFARAGEPTPISTETYLNCEELLLVHEEGARRASWRVEATFALRRGPELVARRAYSFEATPVAEEAP